MNNRKFKKMLPMLALGCCAFGLAACGSCDLADYAPPVLVAPTRKAAYGEDFADLSIQLVIGSDIYTQDGVLHAISDVSEIETNGVLDYTFDIDYISDADGAIGLWAELVDFDINKVPAILTNGDGIELFFTVEDTESLAYFSFVGVTWSDWYNECFAFDYDAVNHSYNFAYSYTRTMAGDDVVGGVVDVLTGGITGLGQGIASGVNTFINSLAFSNGSLSPYFILTIVFGALSLAVGLTTLVYNWLTDLGGSK